MPVPKRYEAEYSKIVATQTARLERMGHDKASANSQAKAMADEHVAKLQHKEKKKKGK